jgi:hypothetical protein
MEGSKPASVICSCGNCTVAGGCLGCPRRGPAIAALRWRNSQTGQHPHPPLLTGSLDPYRPIQLQLIQDAGQRRLFREYLDRYHYLGYRAPFGAQLRYWVRPANPALPPLACLLFTSAAWRMAPRDSWIAWTDPMRQLHLPRVVNNSRFLILPWTRIPNLASHILSQAARQLPADWQAHYGVEPVLLETLVDPERYRGTC